MKRILAVLLTIAAAGLSGCSSGGRSVDQATGVYGPDELGDFLQATTPSPVANEYLIGVGDQLKVDFFFHGDLSQQSLLVRRDGRVTLPYVGDVMAAGRTPMELDSLLEGRFAEILRDPSLSVAVLSSAEQQVYVLGQVDRGGAFPFDDHVSLVQALAMAGGLSNGATREVLVIRRQGVNKIVGVRVDVKTILEGRGIGNDILLRNYDIVYVPKTSVQSVADFMQTLNDIFQPPIDLILRGWQVRALYSQVELLRAR